MSDSADLPTEGTRGKQIGAVDRVLTKIFTGGHRAVLRLTGGRVMNKMGGNRVLVLTTIGRKSGRPRTHPVIATPDGDGWLIVATNAGAANHPMWLRNVAANPDVRLDVDGRGIPMRTTILTPEEKKAVWPKLLAAYPTYGTMQAKTDRDIPVVRLTPD